MARKAWQSLIAFLLAAGALGAQTKAPLLVLLDGDAKVWQGWCEAAKWQFLAPWSGSAEKSIDLRIKALEGKVAEAAKQGGVDETRVYLAGQGDGASTLFYVASRVPDLWAGAVALGGTPRPAMDSNRLFAANTTLVPVLWIFPNAGDEALAKTLKADGYNLEWKVENAANPEQILGWLAAHRRDQFPAEVDCETGTPAFPRCYWIEMTKFDPAQRNDVLDSTRVQPIGSGAVLDLGGFGFNLADPGPGVLVAFLPPKYQGPLKLNDRIVSIGGKPLADAKAYARLMDETTEDKPVAIAVQRGKERVRLETRIVVPRREETVTARVQGKYLPELKEIQILSRTVSEMRITVPEAWVPSAINWNGSDLARAEAPGCWLLEEQKQLLSVRRCP